MFKPLLAAGLAFSITSLAAIAHASFAPGTQATTDVITRTCPSGQEFDSVSGTCKSFFDIRGSFAKPVRE